MVEAGHLVAREWPVGEFGNGGTVSGRSRWSAMAIVRRMRRLRDGGLLDSRRFWYDRPTVWTVTKAGLREAGLPLEAAVVDVRTYDHDLDAALLCIELEQEFEVVLTEREVAHVDAGETRGEFSPQAMDMRRIGQRRHLPDFAVPSYDERGRPLGIELERTAKYRTRLRDIVSLYAEAAHLAGVRYYVTSEEAKRAVLRAVDEVAMSEFPPAVEVRRWHPPRPQ